MMFYSKEAAIKHANARAKQTNKNYVVIQDEPDQGLCESVPLDTWNDSPFFQGCKDSQCIHTTCYPD